MTTHRRLITFGAATLIALASSSVRAQTGDKASAVLLYDEALRLSAAGKMADACVKYAESQRLDPQLGTLLHLGDCYEKSGQTASAWASFREATELAGNRGDAREKVARKRAAALERQLAKLIIDVPPSLHGAGVRVERDGKSVGAGAWGVAVPTDPGTHVVSASATGRTSWSDTVTVAPAAVVRVTIPELAPSIDAPASTPPLVALGTDPGGTSPANAQAQPGDVGPSSGSGQRVAGFVVMGAGLVGVGVGTYFGLRAIDRNNAAEGVCPGMSSCPAGAGDQVARHTRLVNEASSARTMSIVGFAAGGAALVGGLVLVLTAPSGEKKVGLAPLITAGGGGFAVSGGF